MSDGAGTRGGWPDPEVATGVPPEFIRLLIAGRWIVVATVLVTALLPQRFPMNQPVVLALAAVITAYNLGQRVLLREGRLRRLPPYLFVGIDLLLVTLLDWFSGGLRSPFLNLYYILIITGAAFGNLRGSLLTAAAVTVLEAVMVASRPTGEFRVLRLNYMLTTVPYLYLTAVSAGYLVRRLREQWERRQDAEAALDRMDRELEIAREVQSTFLHAMPPAAPGLTIAAHSSPLYGIGGDMQDYVPLPDGVAIAVADVAGHSLGAALLGARLAHMLDEVGLGKPLPDVLAAWNRIIVERTSAEVFVTAVLCEVHYGDGAVHYGIAGHPPPLVWRRATGEASPLPGGGTVLGALPDARYEIRETRLEPGDVLLLYTDGATEARDPEGNLLETEGLSALLARRASLPAQEIVDRLADDIAAGREVRDDLTLVVVTRDA